MRGREKTSVPPGSLAGWVMERWRARRRGSERAAPRLRLIERIALAPRQSLALVEAEGRHLLVATSAEGAPAFHALEETAPGKAARAARTAAKVSARVSW